MKWIKCQLFSLPVKPYRTPPSSNIQFSATQKCCGVIFFFFFCIFFLQYVFFQLKNSFLFFCQFRSIFLFFIYRKMIPQNIIYLVSVDVFQTFLWADLKWRKYFYLQKKFHCTYSTYYTITSLKSIKLNNNVINILIYSIYLKRNGHSLSNECHGPFMYSLSMIGRDCVHFTGAV